MASYSLIIRNGHIINGKKTPLIRADIGIRGQHIEFIGDLTTAVSDKDIDASGKYVVPGFIDLTNHSDTHWTIFNYPKQESLLWQGITTIVGGNCGTSLAPLVTGQEIDALQKWVDTSSINVNWQTFHEYFQELERHSFGVNIATLVGFGTLRRGTVANINGPASAGEISKMQYLLENALQEGAFGLSTSLGRAHEQLAGKEELLALAQTLDAHGALLKHHLRDEGMEILPAISEVTSLSREALQNGNENSKQALPQRHLQTQISHFKLLGKSAWNLFDEVIEMIERARADIPLTIDIFPYTRTGSNLYLLLPPWAKEGGKESMLDRLSNEKERKTIIDDLRRLTLHYDRMVVTSTLRDFTPIGKTIAKLAEETNLSPEEVFINLLSINNLMVSIFNEVVSEEHIVRLSKKEYSMFATDGSGINVVKTPISDLPHPRSFATFPKVLSTYVKDKGVLGWEEAIYKMTRMPAEIIGIEDRGIIQKGACADIVIFDPEKIIDKSTYENPLQYSEGIEWVILNGHVAIGQDGVSKDMFGKIIKKTPKK